MDGTDARRCALQIEASRWAAAAVAFGYVPVATVRVTIVEPLICSNVVP